MTLVVDHVCEMIKGGASTENARKRITQVPLRVQRMACADRNASLSTFSPCSVATFAS